MRWLQRREEMALTAEERAVLAGLAMSPAVATRTTIAGRAPARFAAPATGDQHRPLTTEIRAPRLLDARQPVVLVASLAARRPAVARETTSPGRRPRPAVRRTDSTVASAPALGELGQEITPTARQQPQQARDGRHDVALGYGSEQLVPQPLGPEGQGVLGRSARLPPL